ncbi:hypothetical protein GWK48_09050 [Metallosphaera tengchongensis]|uniref:Uncharacterized protein n=1 Tax=Metallosphaera tengchongensis TaxID=1532350 RepID=A0A6N0NY51_9CREN|nr:hypothetical protein [Metallosphaera tengchongensis]QKR00499.1 hypothetical protein GWK48_09050 [Metallosphaera tengchongensis]
MSVDIDSNSPPLQMNTEGTGEAAAHILAAVSILKGLNELNLESLEIARRYVDNWISTLVPLEYIPGMAEFVGGKLKRSLMDVFDEISEEELGETLEILTTVKRSLDMGDIPYNIAEAEVRMERVFRALGLEMNDFGRFLENSDLLQKMRRTVSLFALAVGIASVWDRKWIAESQ